MTLRRVEALVVRGIEILDAAGTIPKLTDADPADLWVDESYQRSLSGKSIGLIRGMVERWDWRAFKPPTVVRDHGKLHVIDGQHTAIAAATRGLTLLPVMIVDAPEVADRARAFVGINSDRISVGSLTLHHAQALAGDEDEQTLDLVCKRAGAVVLRSAKPGGQYAVGDVVAIQAVRHLVQRRHAGGARRVLEVCVKAKLAPLDRTSILAVDALLFDLERVRREDLKLPVDLDPEDIATCLRAPSALGRARIVAANDSAPLWLGLARVIDGMIAAPLKRKEAVHGRASAA